METLKVSASRLASSSLAVGTMNDDCEECQARIKWIRKTLRKTAKELIFLRKQVDVLMKKKK